jgi:DNA processing protein
MNEEECLYTLALSMTPGLMTAGKRRLIEEAEGAAEVFHRRREWGERYPELSERFLASLGDGALLSRAEAELRFCREKYIRPLSFRDPDYPSRLRDCPDAPILLFFRGSANLNALRVVNMVGTRHATPYGQDICDTFVRDLAQRCPDVLIVSGLAYGIDIMAHRAALHNGLPTVGVLAHGLDRIYPAVHRLTASQMVEQGGLLTEYPTATNPDRQNFIARNRIVAGMCDATIVVESAAKGGALITAGIAESYHRDCFAFPGRTSDPYSIGCNRLIQHNQAALLTSADDFIEAMGWEAEAEVHPRGPVQRELFPELGEMEQRVVDTLRAFEDGLPVNTLVVKADIPIDRMMALLFELEMKGMVRALAGGVYRLIR